MHESLRERRMTKVRWTEDLATGDATIDEQHRELLRRMDDVLSANDAGNRKDRIIQILNYLEQYVEFHFDSEEAAMKRSRYPQAKDHMQQHEMFRWKLRELLGEVGRSGAELGLIISTNRLMIDWLLNHIRKSDVELARFLKVAGERV